MLSLLPCAKDFRGDRGDEDVADVALCGEKLAFGAVGGLNMRLQLELLKGRRTGLETEGMGAWLVMGILRSNTSSWKICNGSFEPENGVALAMTARSSYEGKSVERGFRKRNAAPERVRRLLYHVTSQFKLSEGVRVRERATLPNAS